VCQRTWQQQHGLVPPLVSFFSAFVDSYNTDEDHSMVILVKHNPNASCPSFGLESCFLLDACKQASGRRLSAFKDTVVHVFPHHPLEELGCSSQHLTQCLRCVLTHLEQPFDDGCFLCWRGACHSEPRQYSLPDYLGERAGQDRVWCSIVSGACPPSRHTG
jgi:hypothetical protein